MIAVIEGLKATIGCLERSGLEYMAVGSIAAAIYGEPRLTRDIDIVIGVKNARAANFINHFDQKEFYLPPEAIVSQELAQRGQFNLLHNDSGLKIDIVVQKSTPHAVSELSRRRRLEILPQLKAWLAAPEDVIIAKLRYYREGESEKHLQDIRGILAQTTIDQHYLDQWVDKLSLISQWKCV